MGDITDYRNQISEALNNRQRRLEKTELPKMKEEFRVFHTAFAALYAIFLNRKLIREDPYKQDTKIVDIEVPDTGPFGEGGKVEEFSIRLSHYDNQLDFLINFYPFNLESMSLEAIKRILALVKYIDWVRFTPESSPNTAAMVDLINQTKSGADQLNTTVIGNSLTTLSKFSLTILKDLKETSDFSREAYKLELRDKITSTMPPTEAVQIALIKKKFAPALPGKPFYAELVEEVIREDYSKNGPVLRTAVLKQFAASQNKEKSAKAQVSFKTTLTEGLYAISGAAAILREILPKLSENHETLQSRKKKFWEKAREMIQQMLNQEPDPVMYEVEYIDSGKGGIAKEKVNFTLFCNETERTVKALVAVSARGGAANKLEAMEEDELLALLEQHIRDIQSAHKILSALDDLFKNSADKDDRNKIKGIKPELGTLKNVLIKANQKRYEYNAQKEEEEQYKQLGINTGS